MVTVLVGGPLAVAAVRAVKSLIDKLGEANRVKTLSAEGENTKFADFAVTWTKEEVELIKANEVLLAIVSTGVERAKHHKGL